MLKSYAILG